MIITSDLSKSFGQVQAVKQVNLHVKEGTIFGLVGPDGAGKTTLLRMICGLITPDEGVVSLAGYSAGEMEQAKENLGYMPQRFSLYGDLTIMENIDFFAAMYKLDKHTVMERADEILSLTNLSDFKQRLADNLSGGMKQKLALTCALITRPRLLVLDEPTYGVDPESRKEFWKILYSLNREGMTVMVSTAYMDEAELCNQVAFINEGRIKANDSPAGLRKSFGHRILEVRAVVRDPYILNDLLPVLDVSFFGYKYQVVVDDVLDATEAIVKHLEGKNITLVSINEVSPSMEDVFVLLAEKEVV
ncbi:MAG: ABC transporter ATP-binding protein [Firmicutes bacterium HGW-Firmicutes-15]|nr:MAG: ABC transporter ATP-binding protein [Firmicutes bacterium HGW-Firmicutes-15]